MTGVGGWDSLLAGFIIGARSKINEWRLRESLAKLDTVVCSTGLRARTVRTVSRLALPKT